MTTHATSLRPYTPQLLFVGGISLTLLVLGILGAASLPRLENMGAITSYSLIALGTILAASMIYAVYRIRNRKTQAQLREREETQTNDMQTQFKTQFPDGFVPKAKEFRASLYLTALALIPMDTNMVPPNTTLHVEDQTNPTSFTTCLKENLYKYLIEGHTITMKQVDGQIVFIPTKTAVEVSVKDITPTAAKK